MTTAFRLPVRRPMGARSSSPTWILAALILAITHGRTPASSNRRKIGRGLSKISSASSSRAAGAEDEQPEKGADLEYAFNIDFWQAIKGTQAKIEVTRHEVCPSCHGSGQGADATTMTCPQCNGTGQVTQMAGAMKFSLTCPRCNGKGGCGMPAQRAMATAGSLIRRLWKCASRRGRRVARGCACQVRAMRERWALRGRSVHYYACGAPPVL